MFQNIKSRFLKAGVLALCIACTGPVSQAQLVLPSTPDIFFYNPLFTGSYIAGINTAAIRYSDLGTAILYVSDYFGNGPRMRGGVVIRDLIFNNQVQFDYAVAGSPGYMRASPDIIVGNSIANPTNEYIVAAAYIDQLSFQPQIDYYTVTYTGLGTFLAAYTGSTTITGIGRPNTIHLDIIAEDSVTGLTGYPFCDRFVVTWDESASGSEKVYAFETSLNAPAATIATGSAQLINTPLVKGLQPDVAAVQRQPCPSCPIEDWALITYVNAKGDALYYAEWNTATLTVTNTLMYSAPPTTIEMPRIDAPDGYVLNATPGISYYKIAARINATSSYTFDNLMGPGAFWNNASMTPGKIEAPTVAFGENGNTQYAVAEYAYAAPNVYLEPIDWTLSTALALSPSSLPNWFQVNTNPPNFLNGNFLTAISTPCNGTNVTTLVAWSSFDPVANISTVHYKNSPYFGPNGYNFRPAPEANAPAPAWQVYPNPATTNLTITNPGDNNSYIITDMAGRGLLHGLISGSMQSIDISSLAPGTYIVSLGNNGTLTDKATFVKE